MDRPIGQSTNAPSPTTATAEKVKGEKKAAPAAWKQDAKWVAAEEIHATIVAQIKSEGDPVKLETHRASLREQEEAMKALKQELRGDKPSA